MDHFCRKEKKTEAVCEKNRADMILLFLHNLKKCTCLKPPKDTVRYRQHTSASSYNFLDSEPLSVLLPSVFMFIYFQEKWLTEQSSCPTFKGVCACVFIIHTIGGTLLYSGQHSRLFTGNTSTITAQCFYTANLCQHQGDIFTVGLYGAFYTSRRNLKD